MWVLSDPVCLQDGGWKEESNVSANLCHDDFLRHCREDWSSCYALFFPTAGLKPYGYFVLNSTNFFLPGLCKSCTSNEEMIVGTKFRATTARFCEGEQFLI